MKRGALICAIMAITLTACGGTSAASVPPTTELPPTAAALSAIEATLATTPSEQDLASRLDTVLNKMAKSDLFNGSLLIAQKGMVLVSKGYGMADHDKQIANTPQTKFRIGSITKQFTAMAILMLQAQGKLKVQDPICHYLWDCPAAWQPITIHQLLTHTSGIPNFTDFPDYRKFKKSPSTPIQTIAQFKDKPLDFTPGTKWSYSNSGYIVLGAIIEKVSGKSYEVFLQEHIFAPLKMSNTGYEHTTDILATGYVSKYSKADSIDMSVPFAAGGLYSTVEDLYLWDQALYTDQLVSKDVLDTMFRVAAAVPDSNGLGYGYGWFVGKESNHRWVGHEGGIEGFHTLISRYPDERVTIILLSNHENTSLDIIEQSLGQIVFGDQ
jgi:CubicO group peptidase (beta-lactamase class C family)